MSTHPRTLLLVALSAANGCAAPADEPFADIGAAPIAWPLNDPEALNGACEACHAPEAAQWRGSLHRDAFSNDAFTRSFAREPTPFCQACHAPHADPGAPPPAWAAANGVTCVTCHIEAGAVRAAATARSPAASPHPLARSPEFTGARACAGCHEFEFPRSRRYPPGRKMQLTLAEHASSEYAQLSCADCHMPGIDGPDGRHRDHRFDVSRNPPLLRAALTASARRLGPDRLVLELAPVAVGHALPTGDLFRRLELRVDAQGQTGEPIPGTVRYLARHFAPPSPHRPDPPAPDDRLRGPTTFEMHVPGALAGSTLRWRVTYQRVDHRDAHTPERSSLAGEVVLAAGELAAYRPPSPR